MTRPAEPPGARARLAPIALPLLAELLLGSSVAVLGTVLAARLGDASAGAFSLAGHVTQSLYLVFRIVGVGVGVVVAQALGAGRRDTADATARAALAAASWVGATLALVSALAAEPLLGLMQAPPDVLPQAVRLMRALAPALLFDAWTATLTSVLRAHLAARTALGVTLLMHALHVALLWPLMFGSGLGLEGYALALLIARAVAVLASGWLWRERLAIALVPRDAWRLPRGVLGPVVHIGLPAAAENIGWRLAFMASLAVVGGMGTAALVTHTYTHQVMVVILLASFAIGLATEVLVGRLIGAGRLRAADRLLHHALLRGFGASSAIALAAALAGPWLLRGFTTDEAIVRSGSMLLWLTVLIEPGRSFNLIVINALRAAGDVRYPVQAGIVSMVVVLAGGSWLLGSVLGLGLPGIWLAYAADEWLRGLLMWRRWKRLAWVDSARAVHRRMRATRIGA